MSLIESTMETRAGWWVPQAIDDSLQRALRNRFVLVIDDDANLLSLMGEVLEEAGAMVSTASDGAEGLKAFAAEPPEVVVTDILMPTKEGIETLLEMKRRKPDVKIVAISGGARLGAQNVLELAKQLGADATLTKPFSFDRLVGTCAALVA